MKRSQNHSHCWKCFKYAEDLWDYHPHNNIWYNQSRVQQCLFLIQLQFCFVDCTYVPTTRTSTYRTNGSDRLPNPKCPRILLSSTLVLSPETPSAAKSSPPLSAAHSRSPSAVKLRPPSAVKSRPPSVAHSSPPPSAVHSSLPPSAAHSSPSSAGKSRPPFAAHPSPPFAAHPGPSSAAHLPAGCSCGKPAAVFFLGG